ncbi:MULTISPECIES: amphi-Trp domain-containing protein [Bacillus]|uniref:amphi-Trp domain-containing protein n=1 Tax=Bacillus TaxID=1386 RepID=UPI0002E20D83|nr:MULTISPECIES: amphi-Trp domain-containing protein [Bacillus]
MQQPRMKNIIIDHKEKQSVEELANMLEMIAQKLKQQAKFTFVRNEKEIEVCPKGTVKTEIKYTNKGSKHSFEIEFDWDEATIEKSKLEIR